MISRHWKGLAKPGRAEEYLRHLQSETFPRLAAIAGFVEASVLRREVEGGTEFQVVTVWESLEAIEAFAGRDADVAVVPAAAQPTLVSYEERVHHYDVAGRLKPGGAPEGFHSLTPRIVTADAEGLVRFLQAAFGATGDVRPDAPAQLRIGDSLVMIGEAGPRPAFPAFLYAYVDDADETYGRALQAGAVSLEPVSDMPYGDRRGMVRDPFGNVWQIATRLK